MTAVVLGAFGAHALKKTLDPDTLRIFETATYYQMIHALALLLIAALKPHLSPSTAGVAAVLFVVGIFLFSGSLYALTLTGIKKLGMITPLGGLSFIAGWLLMAIQALRSSSAS